MLNVKQSCFNHVTDKVATMTLTIIELTKRYSW